MLPDQNPHFETIEQAENYVETAREYYRDGYGEYRGRRNDEQQLIAEVTSDEARLIVDGVMLGALSLGGVNFDSTADPAKPENTDKPIRAGFTWNDFRGEYERLLVGFAVMTNRLQRDGYKVPSYADLKADDRLKAASVLFSDYLSHNALRFGADTAGVKKTEFKTRHTDDGGIERTRETIDKDKAKNDREINENMAKRKYATGFAAHPAGKISTEEYVRLRQEYPEMDKDLFDDIISSARDVRKTLENRE